MRKILASIMVGGLLAGGFASTALADEELAFNLGGPLGDDASTNRPIGFAFNFYGVPYNNVWIGSNGILTFSAGENDFSPSLPEYESDVSGPMVAPLWTDLSPNISGSILYIDSVPGQMSVAYSAVPRFGTPAGTALNSFTVTLFSNGHILYDYGALNYGASIEETIVGLTDRGGSATVLIDLSAQGGTIPLPLPGNIVGEFFDSPGGPILDLANSSILWVPAPGALALLGLAGLVSRRRRRD